MHPTPLCPITGVPASRRIQSISAWLLIGLWRWSFRVATDHQLGKIGHFELWESPCGLAFFEPMLTGDEAFYLELYRRGDFHTMLNASILARTEFRYIAEIVRTGETVLDVGCGEAGLARHLPHATYVGLDPHYYATDTQRDIRNETISQQRSVAPRRIRRGLCLPCPRACRRSTRLCARPRNLHQTRRTSLCCGAEPRFGDNRNSEFCAECTAASSQLVERGCVAGASRPSRSADRSD